MTSLTFNVEQEQYGGYVAEAVINDHEQIITQADSVEELRLMIKDAVFCHFDDSQDAPQSIIMKFTNQEVFAL
jgi:predicted RNase H-like HicB family nuclease